MRNCKENEGRSLGAEKELKSKEKFMASEISQPKEASAKMTLDFTAKITPYEIATLHRNYFTAPRSRCENATLLRNHFAAPCTPLWKFSQLQNHLLAHECHFAASYPHFAAAKWLWNPQSLKNSIFAAKAPFRLVFHNYETPRWHMSAISQQTPLISQLPNGLRKWPFFAKSAFLCEN